MPVEVILPRVDMDMATGKIARWYAEAGQQVAQGEPLFEIETDKAAMEIEAPASGILRDIKAEPGIDVAVGSTVAFIYAADEAWSPAAAPAPAAAAVAAPVLETTATTATKTEAPIPAAPVDIAGKIRATPLARKLASGAGLDLSAIAGTGPRGRIVSDDVRAAASALPKVGAASAPAPVPASAPAAPAVIAAPPVAPRPAAQHGLSVHRREGTGTPVVFLHGFGSESGSWAGLFAAVEPGRPILAFDLPSHGRSPVEDVPSIAALAERIADALRAEGVDEAHVVAHSLGGATALALADLAPALVRSLVLIAPAGLGADIDGAFLDGFSRATSKETVEPWLGRLVADRKHLSPGFVAVTAKGRADAERRDAQARIARTVFPAGTQTTDLRGVFERIAVPVRVVWGVADAIIPWKHALGLPGRVGLHLIPGAGHLPQLEARDTVAAIVTETIRSTGA
ncbi:acetoin dehydrogenase dihydrolipoyllysine-residue acetyltransferase subunit [Methyloraptor flagellatus]|uniref:Acetoin dehydrogenase dihydrolipoyllysine-residue acetyltransferase subunit n=1 Tax=Methyloraptor flagellatus TaxID=3162530 RepID=A0AAU7X9R5_9HYPH